MKTTAAGTVSGCIVWIIVFGILSFCLFPVSIMIGGMTAPTQFAMQTLGPMLCPAETTAESYSYPSTTTDQYGNTQPSTAYELHCVDPNGIVVKEDPVQYAFLWTGIMAALGFAIAALLAFALAAPVGVLIARLLNRVKKTSFTANIEPE